MKNLTKRWPDHKEDCPGDRNETQHLEFLVDIDWDFTWPGWKSIARKLNAEYGNNRTAKACSVKYNSLSRRGRLAAAK